MAMVPMTIDMAPFDPKSIGNSETLMHDSDTEEEIAPVIKTAERKKWLRGPGRIKKVGCTVTRWWSKIRPIQPA
jgi:hypothetical protein